MKTPLRLAPGLRFLPAILLLAAMPVLGQASSVNYAFTTSTSGSLTDMSSGTTQLVAPGADDSASAVTNIGFDFFFMGTRYSQFSASSNGYMRLGGTAVSASQYTLGTAGFPLITAMGSDLIVSTTGKVHYKVLGSAPNRVLVVEYKNMTIIYDGVGTSTDGTYQIRLYETSGVIELVYGAMNRNAGTGFSGADNPQYIGFSTNSTSGTLATIDTANTLSTTAATANKFPMSAPMASLTSSADGSRRVYTFTPPIPAPPGGPMTFTGVSATGMTLNWTDSANELGYAIYRSTDGINFSFIATAAQNATFYAATGLLGSVPYTWIVDAYSEGGLAGLTGVQTTTTPGTVASTASGLWSATTTWAGGVVPTASDAVTIAAGNTVTIDSAAAAVAYSVTIANTGALVYQVAAPTTSLTVGTDVTIQSGGSFQSAATGTQTGHTLTVNGNLTNNGTLDFSTNGNTAGANIVFAGPVSATFSGTGATTHVRQITMNKGTSQASMLEIMPTNFTASTGAAAWLVTPIQNGTLKISGTFTYSGPLLTAAGWSVTATAGLWMNNPNITVTAQNGTGTISGLFRMSQGTFNLGTVQGNVLGFANGATVIVEGGAINCASRFGVNAATNAITYTQTAGTITVNTVSNTSTTIASFDMGTGASVVNMSGGTIIVQLAGTGASGPHDYRNAADGLHTTGGTLRLGNALSGAAKAFRVTDVVPNLVIDTTSGGHSATWQTPVAFYPNALDVTIGIGGTLSLNVTANGLFFMNGSTFTNNGTLTSTCATCRFYWNGFGFPQTYTGTGVTTAPMTSLDLDNEDGLTFSSTNQVITSRVNLFAGSITNANKITLGNGAATTGTVQIGGTTDPLLAGTFDVPMTFNLGTGGETIYYLRTGASRVTGGEVNPARSLTSLQFDDNDVTHTLTVAGGDLAVTGTATLTNGRLITGANTLAIGGAGSVTRTAGYVDGNFKKNFTAVGSKTFEVGTANGYSPVAYNATAGTFPADATVKAIQAVAPGVVPATTALNRYWTLTATGLTADLTFNYLDLDVPGTATEANFKLFRHDGGGFTDMGATIDTSANTATVTGVTTFSDWTLAEQIALPPTATVSGDATICSGGSTTIQAALTGTGPWNVTWSDAVVQSGVAASPATRLVSPSSTITYTVTALTDAFYPSGSSSGSATVTVNPTPGTPAAANDGPVCEGGTLNLTTPTVPGATYAWAGPNGFISALQNPSIASVTTAATGTYSVTVTVLGCTSPAGTTTATVNAIPATPTAANDGPKCAGSTLNLSTPTVSGAIYAWTGPNGFTSSSQNPSIPSATTAASGTYSVTVAVSGCTSAAGTTIAVVNAVPSAPTAGNNGPICEGATLNLTATPGGPRPMLPSVTYTWTGPNGFTSTLQNPSIPNATTAASGTYSVTATEFGCTSSAGTTTVTVNAIPATPTPTNNGPICEGATLNLTTSAVSGAIYAWTGPNGFASALQNPSIASATTAATGTYSVTVTVSGCTSPAGTTSATVNTIPAPPTAANNGPICAGSTLNLTASTVSGATYSWTGPNGFISSTQNPSITNATTAATGTYSVTATVSGCTSTAGTTAATVNAAPGAPAAGNNGPICAGTTLNLTASTVSGATYSWTGPNGFTSTDQNPSITNATTAATGTYSVTVTVSGCTSTAGTTAATVNTCAAGACILTVLPNNGSTSGNERAPQPNFRYGRAVYLITATEMAASGFASGASATEIGWTFFAASGVGPATAPLIVYLENTADVTNLKSTTWTTAITGMTTVHSAATTIPDAVGPYNVTFSGGSPFTYTGGGLYVAFDWGAYAGTLSTTSSILCTTSLTAGLKGAQSSASAPGTIAASNFRPETFLRPSTGPTNDASVDLVYSYGSLPQILAVPNVVQAVVTNRGSNAITSLPVTLTVSGANSFTDTQTVATLAPCGGTATVTFASYTPSAIGSDTLTVTVPADDVAGNNSKAVPVNVTAGLYSYKYPGTTASGGVGLTGSTGTFVAKFTTALETTVTGVNLEFAAASATTYRVAIYPDSGTGTPGTVASYVDAADRTVTAAGPVAITLPSPVAVGPGSFFVGIQQTNTTNVSLSFDTESPIRAGSFFLAIPNPPATWLEFFADGDNFKLNIGVTLTACPSAPTGVPGSRCGTGTVILSASGATAGQDYKWYDAASGGTLLQTGGASFTTPSISATTTYYASITSTTPNCESGRTGVTATVNAVPSAPTAGNDGPICAGSTLNLTASTVSGATYSWTGPNGFTSALQNPSIASATTAATGTYSVTVTVGACASPAGTTAATINAIPTTPVASNDGPVCVGSPLHLTTPTVAGATYLWTDPHGFTTNVQNPTIASATMAANGTYSLTITVNSCTSPAGTMTVTVNAIPGAPTASNDGPICAGTTLHLTTPAVTGATYAWTGPNGFTSATQNPSITNATTAATGTYSVSVTVSGCTSPAGTTTATVNADTTAPVVTAPGSITVDQSLCCGTFGGANGATNATLATYLAAGSATDDCMASPTRLAPQVSGVDVLASTCFEVGTTAVTFRYQDGAGHTGTASSNVTVRMFGDLNMDHVVDPSDMVVMRAYFNFVVTPGTAPFNAPLNMADLTHNTIVDPADLVVLRAYFNFVVSCLAP